MRRLLLFLVCFVALMPLTETSRLTGTPAKVVGVICVVLGVGVLGVTCLFVYARAFPKR